MSERLPVQIRTAFIRQGLFGCLLMLVGIFALSILFSEYRIRTELSTQSLESAQAYRAEPRDGWFEFPRSATFVVANTDIATQLRLLSAVQTPHPEYKTHIARLMQRDPGWAFKPAWQTYKERDGSLMIYTVRSAGKGNRSFYAYISVVALLTILSFALVTWQTYVTMQRTLMPIRKLSDVVRSWRPGRLDPGSLASVESLSHSSTEARNLYIAMNGLATRVNDFMRRESEFLRDASHELRTPLTVIGVATDMLKAQSDGDPITERSLARIQAAAERIQSKLEALMLLTRESEIQLVSEPFEVMTIVEQEVARLLEETQDPRVHVQVHSHSPSVLNGPPQALALILQQLLGNAMRFTDDGRIDVDVHVDRVVVTDSGTGMTHDTMTRAFDPFFKADPFGAEGQGIGLSLVRRLAERVGWHVELTSEHGTGTSAVVHFVD